MTSWTRLASAILFVALPVTTGCGAAEPDTELSDESEESLTRRPLVLRSAEARPLTLTIDVLDGIKPSTKNFRYIKTTLARSGRSFSAFCTLSQRASDSGPRFQVGCETGVRTVSDDDNESLSFSIEKAGNVYTLTDQSYLGDFTFLAEEAQILLGGTNVFGVDPVALAPVGSVSRSPVSNPFVLAERVRHALSALSGDRFYVASLGVYAKIHSVDSWFLSQDMTVLPSFKLGPQGGQRESVTEKISLLRTPGLLPSGLAESSAVTARAKSVLPKR